MKTTKQLLYQKVSAIREGCAGSGLQSKAWLLEQLDEVIILAYNIDAGAIIIGALEKTRELMSHIKRYEDRLEPDNILCNLLNKELTD